MPPSSAYLLTSHGSRDSRPQREMEKLAALVKTRIGERNKTLTPYLNSGVGNPEYFVYSKSKAMAIASRVSNMATPLVRSATLELGAFPLHEQIYQFAKEAISYGCQKIKVLPLFLLPGVHVMEDIPQQIAVAQHRKSQTFKSQNLVIEQLPHLGTHPGLPLLIDSQLMADVPAKILVSHGTRRPGGNQVVENIAQELGAIPAYFSGQPTLTEQIENLANQGYKEIAILPYFLFSGGITDALAEKVNHLQQKLPHLQLKLGDTIGATPKLAELILDLLEKT